MVKRWRGHATFESYVAAECYTLVQLSVSGLHCRMSLTMVALPFSTAQ